MKTLDEALEDLAQDNTGEFEFALLRLDLAFNCDISLIACAVGIHMYEQYNEPYSEVSKEYFMEMGDEIVKARKILEEAWEKLQPIENRIEALITKAQFKKEQSGHDDSRRIHNYNVEAGGTEAK